jgi:hypothetical protein
MLAKMPGAQIWCDALKIRAGVLDASLADPKSRRIADSQERVLGPLAEATGMSLGGGNSGVVRAASADDFSDLLAESVVGLVVNRYRAHADHRRLAKIGNVPNFKTHYFANINQTTGMPAISQGGEISQDFVVESGQGLPVNLSSYAKIVNIGRTTIVNDEYDLVFNTVASVGTRAGRLEAGAYYSLLESNPALDDGESMFHVDHGNLMTPAAISAGSLGAGIAAMRNQEIEPGEKSGHKARFWLVSPDLELDAVKLVHESGLDLEVICSPWLTAGTWYLFADPKLAPVIALVYLTGQKDGLSVLPHRNKKAQTAAIRIACDFGVVPVGRIGVIKGSIA